MEKEFGFCFSMQRDTDIQGILSSWTTPIQDSDGFTSTLCLSLDTGFSFQLVVTTALLEDHVWPTHTGQRVVATDVVFDSATSFATKGWSNSASLVVVPEQEKDHRSSSTFVDLPTNKITGFQHKPGGMLFVFLENETRDVVCFDGEKSSELLRIGIGGHVALFNVKVKVHQQREVIFIERSSGIRTYDPPAPATPLPSLSPPPPLRFGLDKSSEKWICVSCGFQNFPSKGKCWKCEMSRKEGPLYKDSRHFKVEKAEACPVYERLLQWMCLACRNRENFYFRDTCVRCGAIRVEKTKERKKGGGKKKMKTGEEEK